MREVIRYMAHKDEGNNYARESVLFDNIIGQLRIAQRKFANAVSNASLLSGASAARVSEKEGGHHEFKQLIKISHFDPEALMGVSVDGASDMFT